MHNCSKPLSNRCTCLLSIHLKGQEIKGKMLYTFHNSIKLNFTFNLISKSQDVHAGHKKILINKSNK